MSDGTSRPRKCPAGCGRTSGVGTFRRGRRTWKRTPREHTRDDPHELTEKAQKRLSEGVDLIWHARPLREMVMSVFLANSRAAPPDRRAPDDQWLYQPEIKITTDGPRILGREVERTAADPDPDIASADLLYRSFHEYATGHGVSVNWNEGPSGDRADSVWTDVTAGSRGAGGHPRERSRGPSPPTWTRWRTRDGESVGALLEPLLNAYAEWITSLEEPTICRGSSQPDDAVAADHLTLARAAHSSGCGQAWSCCRPTGRADRVHLRQSGDGTATPARHPGPGLETRGDTASLPKTIIASWRPFQIGFILQCLPGLADPGPRRQADRRPPLVPHRRRQDRGVPRPDGIHDRDAAAAAGDTRARGRRRHRGAHAVHPAAADDPAVPARSHDDLRLRASPLGGPGDWGEHPITIGLWVGQNATPNSFEDSEEGPQRPEGRTEGSTRRTPTSSCTALGAGTTSRPHDYVADRDLERTLVKCRNLELRFRGGQEPVRPAVAPVSIRRSIAIRHRCCSRPSTSSPRCRGTAACRHSSAASSGIARATASSRPRSDHSGEPQRDEGASGGHGEGSRQRVWRRPSSSSRTSCT